MKFETKYNINDEFWLLRDNKIKKFHVNRIVISQHRESNGSGCFVDKTIAFYHSNTPLGEIFTTENEFFPTKEDLLKSL